MLESNINVGVLILKDFSARTFKEYSTHYCRMKYDLVTA